MPGSMIYFQIMLVWVILCLVSSLLEILLSFFFHFYVHDSWSFIYHKLLNIHKRFMFAIVCKIAEQNHTTYNKWLQYLILYGWMACCCRSVCLSVYQFIGGFVDVYAISYHKYGKSANVMDVWSIVILIWKVCWYVVFC